MSILLTWSGIYTGDLASADYDVNATFDALYSALSTAGAGSDFPWSICSSDLVGPLKYVTLKRKNSDPGRIVFMLATAGGSLNTRLQQTPGQNIAASIVVFYRDGATNDIPANILEVSSDPIFVNEVNSDSTPVSFAFDYLTPGESFSVIGNEDMVLCYSRTDADSFARYMGAGLILVDSLDVAHSGIMCSTQAFNSTFPVTYPGASGILRKDPTSGDIEHWGLAFDYTSGFIESVGRDNGLKRLYFPRIQLGSFMTADKANSMKFQLRQMSFKVAPLVNYETVTNSASDVFARSLTAVSSGSKIWACNFKLNV